MTALFRFSREEDLENLDAICMMGRSMQRIADDVLSLARIQLSTLEIFRVEMDLQQQLTRVYSIFGNEWSVYLAFSLSPAS
jgi:hypothetical protein